MWNRDEREAREDLGWREIAATAGLAAVALLNVLADAETSVLNLGLGLDLGGSLALSWSGRNSGRPVRDQADAEADSDRATENDHADGAAGRAALPS